MFRVLVFVFLLHVLTFGNTIDAQIEAIKNAPQDVRFKLMNKFKKKMVKLKEKERIKAMVKLKTATKNKYNKRVIEELKKANKLQQKQKREEQIQHETEEHIENFIEEAQEEHDD